VRRVTKKQKQAAASRRQHRSAGIAAAVFMIFLVVTGLAINHSQDLRLGERFVTQDTVLDWYGLAGPESISSFEIDGDWLSFAGSQLYLNGNSVTALADGVGAVAVSGLRVAAGRQELVLLDTQGQLVERLSWGPAGAGPIESVGVSGTRLAVRTADQTWLADDALLGWELAGNPGPIAWSAPGDTPTGIEKTVKRHYRGDGLSLERVLLDLHSGRFFGPVGVLVYDLLALSVGFLAVSGLFLWARGRRNGNRNGKRRA
jgi:hypothetical protein